MPRRLSGPGAWVAWVPVGPVPRTAPAARFRADSARRHSSAAQFQPRRTDSRRDSDGAAGRRPASLQVEDHTACDLQPTAGRLFALRVHVRRRMLGVRGPQHASQCCTRDAQGSTGVMSESRAVAHVGNRHQAGLGAARTSDGRRGRAASDSLQYATPTDRPSRAGPPRAARPGGAVAGRSAAGGGGCTAGHVRLCQAKGKPSSPSRGSAPAAATRASARRLAAATCTRAKLSPPRGLRMIS